MQFAAGPSRERERERKDVALATGWPRQRVPIDGAQTVKHYTVIHSSSGIPFFWGEAVCQRKLTKLTETMTAILMIGLRVLENLEVPTASPKNTFYASELVERLLYYKYCILTRSDGLVTAFQCSLIRRLPPEELLGHRKASKV